MMSEALVVDPDGPAWRGQRIGPSEISFVLQGPVETENLKAIQDKVASLRKLAPGCEIIISTWMADYDITCLGADEVVLSEDPGELAGIRADGQLANNVNRQIVSSARGLAAAQRRYAVKMRIDATIDDSRFVEIFEQFSEGSAKILVANFFSLDPRMFEQVPFHLSDWLQFGLTDELRTYWSAPLMSAEDSVFYLTHEHASHSTYLDRKFVCRFAVEQHIAIHFAGRLGYQIPRFHNDNTAAVLQSHDRFMVDRVIVADCEQIGFNLSKYSWTGRSAFQRLNCLSHLDWLWLRHEKGLAAATPQMIKRNKRKRLAAATYRGLGPVLPLFYSRQLRGLVNVVLRRLF